MSKKFFRFLRGELNGFYITAINSAVNLLTDSIKEFLYGFGKMQFESDGENLLIPYEYLRGIAVFTGAFAFYVSAESLRSSVKFTTSHIVNGVEYSERGFYFFEDEMFHFKRTDPIEFDTDINTEAIATERSSLVEEGREPLGYFPEGERIFLDNGELDLSKLMPAPRPNHADSPFYGEDFLYLAENVPINAVISKDIVFETVKAMQWVRYNGMNIKSLVQIAKLICPNYLFITGIDWTTYPGCGVVSYGIDEDYGTEDKLMGEQVFLLIVKKKLLQFNFNRVNIVVTRDADGNVISVDVV